MNLQSKNNKSNLRTGLYLVSTPIGNMADISYRAISVLKNSDLILCEDTRISKKLISKYKDMGLDVTAEVTPHHLGLTQFKLGEFDAIYKISPPLRSEEDRLALVDALKTGVIDCISSDHFPHKIEDKESDLINSKSGVIGLESAFSYSYKILSESGFSIETSRLLASSVLIGIDAFDAGFMVLIFSILMALCVTQTSATNFGIFMGFGNISTLIGNNLAPIVLGSGNYSFAFVCAGLTLIPCLLCALYLTRPS